jgi:hypothetical protein
VLSCIDVSRYAVPSLSGPLGLGLLGWVGSSVASGSPSRQVCHICTMGLPSCGLAISSI